MTKAVVDCPQRPYRQDPDGLDLLRGRQVAEDDGAALVDARFQEEG